MSYSQRAEIYEVEYQEERDVPFVLSLLNASNGRVVELPCGAGRLSRHLAHKAKTLDVVDLEPQMVERAVAAANASNSACKVTGHVQDMRSLLLEHQVDFAILPREGLQLVPPHDGEKVLSAIAANLAPNGLLLIDLARFVSVVGDNDPDYYKHGQFDGAATLDWTRQLSDGTSFSRSTAQSDKGDSIVFDMQYVQGSNPPKEWSAQMQIYRYNREWVVSSVPEGMQLEAFYGDYDRSALRENSTRIIALLRKLPKGPPRKGVIR